MHHLFKQILSIAVLMLWVNVSLAYSFKVNKICYTKKEDPFSVVVDFDSNEKYTGDIIIPDRVNYLGRIYDVVGVVSKAFKDCYDLKSVEFPNSIIEFGTEVFRGSGVKAVKLPCQMTTLPERTFSGCALLTEIELPAGIISIGKRAFDNCAVHSIILPDNVTEIRDSAFWGASLMTEITLSKSLEIIGQNAFDYCKSLASVTIPESTKEIGANAFSYCEHLKELFLPESMCSIGKEGFRQCVSLTSVSIPEGITELSKSLFFGCTSLSAVNLPGSIEVIGEMAFYNCSALQELILPSSVKKIERDAFASCKNLKYLTCRAFMPPILDFNPFQSIGYTYEYGGTLYVPQRSQELYCNASIWKNWAHIYGEFLPACAPPVIERVGDDICFLCDTPKAKFCYTVTPIASLSLSGLSETMAIQPITRFRVSVYATSEGYDLSDTVEEEFDVFNLNVNGDSSIDHADVVALVKQILDNK